MNFLGEGERGVYVRRRSRGLGRREEGCRLCSILARGNGLEYRSLGDGFGLGRKGREVVLRL